MDNTVTKRIKKEKLTKQDISKSLLSERKRGIYTVISLCLMLFILGMAFMIMLDDDVWRVILFSVFVFLAIILFLSYTDKLSQIRRGEYYVSVDKATKIAMNEDCGLRYSPAGKRYIRDIQDNIYFENYGKFTLSRRSFEMSEVEAVMQYSDVGDEFYVVILNGSPVRVYNKKIYEYEDCDAV